MSNVQDCGLILYGNFDPSSKRLFLFRTVHLLYPKCTMARVGKRTKNRMFIYPSKVLSHGTKPLKNPSSRSRSSIGSVGLLMAVPIDALIEQDVAMIRIAGIFTGGAVECLQGGFRDHLDIVIIKGQPMIMALDFGYVVSLVGSAPQMDHHSKERVLAVCIIRYATELQLQRVHHSIRQFLVPIKLLDELEALQVYNQYLWYLLYLHPFLCFL